MDEETEGTEKNNMNDYKGHQAPSSGPWPARRSGTDLGQRQSNADMRRSLSVSHGFLLRRVLPASASGLRDQRLKSFHQNVHRSRLYKVMVVGEVNTGKSALVRRYVHNFFSDRGSYRATLGVDFQLKLINLNDEIEIRLQLWDIAGQERFCNMTRAYYKGAVGAFLVCDASNVKTLDALAKWKKDLDSKCKTPNGRPIPCILILNKSDLSPDPKFPDADGVTKFARDLGCVLPWYGASAKTGQGVQEAMNRMVRQVMAVDTWSYPRFSESETETDTDSSVFSDRTDTPKKGVLHSATLVSNRDVRDEPHCGC